jgi:hypothetical protein
MTSELRQLIDETIALTGAAPPEMLDGDAPLLAESGPAEMYIVGLVGGKDVGKSSLVNALAGEPITRATSHGPGTETVVAYVHRSMEPELRALLSREVADRFTIITHDIAALGGQVLLDLPDIDSRYEHHIQITRRMLRHMLYPLWIQSIEKYADQRPQQLLAAVAEGNDPANFIFCLNKADQLVAREGRAAADELRSDYASRVAKAIGLPEPPKVCLISATQRDDFDLPALRNMLSHAKPRASVTAARGLAQRRQDRSLFGWLGRQRLSERLEQLKRIEHDAEEMTADRIAVPLLDEAIPRMLDDPGMRMALLAPATRRRMARWPIVNAIDSLLSPVMALVQKNLSASPTSSADPNSYLGAGSVAASVQAAFAQLHQLHPSLGEIYRDRRPWEAMHADLASAELSRLYDAVVQRQRQSVMERVGGGSVILAPFRWLLTIGAILWFPIVQPILAVMLQESTWRFTRRMALVVVEALSVAHLLQCTTFLLLWFGVLWMLLRFGTQRRVARIIAQWKTLNGDEGLSLAAQTLRWIDELLDPIRRRREQIQRIVEKSEKLGDQLKIASPVEARPRPAESRV